MSTTSTIGSASRNYSTITAWNAAFANGGWIGQCYNDQEFSNAHGETFPISFSAATASANYITLTTATGQSFRDNASVQTNGLPGYNQSYGVGIKKTSNYPYPLSMDSAYVTLSYLQVAFTGATGSNPACLNGADSSGATAGLVDSCIFDTTNGNSGSPVVRTQFNTHVINSLIVQRGTAGDGIQQKYAGTPVWCNNTIVRPSNVTAAGKALTSTGSPIVKTYNNAGFGFSSFQDVISHFSGNNNASDVAIGFGSSNQASLTYASQFNSSTGNWIPKTGSALLDNGATETSYIASIDIVGTSRPQGSAWDIGCWEYTSSGTNVSLPAASGTSAIGSFGPSSLLALTGAAGSGVAAGFTPNDLDSLAPASAVAAIGSMTPLDAVPLASVAGVASIGSLTPQDQTSLAGAAGAGIAGAFTPQDTLALSPATATASVQSFGPQLLFSLTSAAGVGFVEGFTPKLSFSFTAASGSGVAGNFVSGQQPLPAVSGSGVATGFTPDVLPALSASSGTGVALGFGENVQPPLGAATATALVESFGPQTSRALASAPGAGIAAGLTPGVTRSLSSASGAGAAANFIAGALPLGAASGTGIAATFLSQIIIGFAPATGFGFAGSFTAQILGTVTPGIATAGDSAVWSAVAGDAAVWIAALNDAAMWRAETGDSS